MEDSFTTREHQFEAKFAHDEELKFKIVAHRNKLFAAWVAAQMGDRAPPHYAGSFLEFALGRTPSELIKKAASDMSAQGVAMEAPKLHKAFVQLHDQSEADVKSGAPPA
jgi:hypothetical protein